LNHIGGKKIDWCESQYFLYWVFVEILYYFSILHVLFINIFISFLYYMYYNYINWKKCVNSYWILSLLLKTYILFGNLYDKCSKKPWDISSHTTFPNIFKIVDDKRWLTLQRKIHKIMVRKSEQNDLTLNKYINFLLF